MAVKQYSYKTSGNVSLSAHFKVREFRCKDGTDSILIEDQLVAVLERIYDNFKCSKITITSGYRTPAHDKRVGGKGGGNHCEGKAADFMAYDKDGKAISSVKIVLFLEDIGVLGIGYRCGGNAYATHVDINYRTKKWFGDEKISMSKSIWDINGSYSYYDYLGVKRKSESQPKPVEVAPQVTSGIRYKIVCSGLAVRNGAGTSYKKVGYVNQGAIVTIVDVSGSWGKIGEGKWISIKPSYVTKI